MAKIGEVQEIAIDKLVPYERNAKIHSEEQVEKLAQSIKEFGFINPCLIDKDYNVIAGHGRIEGAKKLGMETVPCLFIEGLTDTQRKAYILADNKLGELAEWDMDIVNCELMDLQLEGFNVDITGFDDVGEEEPPEYDEDDYDGDVPKTAKTKRGDIYQLGRHRLMCGDSVDDADIAKLMDGHTAKILFTSPPYSDMREYNGDKDVSVSNLINFIKCYAPYTSYEVVNLGLQIKNMEVYPYWDAYIDKAHECGLKLMAWNVWDKRMCGSIGMEKAFFPIRHEWIFVFGNEFYKINRTWEKQEASIKQYNHGTVRQPDGTMRPATKGDTLYPFKRMESVLTLNSETGKIRELHPAVFPVGLPAEYIKAMTAENDNIIEPFCGSGTTMIACEELGRNCYGMELGPCYCDVIIDRWEQYTGEKAVLLNG